MTLTLFLLQTDIGKTLASLHCSRLYDCLNFSIKQWTKPYKSPPKPGKKILFPEQLLLENREGKIYFEVLYGKGNFFEITFLSDDIEDNLIVISPGFQIIIKIILSFTEIYLYYTNTFPPRNTHSWLNIINQGTFANAGIVQGRTNLLNFLVFFVWTSWKWMANNTLRRKAWLEGFLT